MFVPSIAEVWVQKPEHAVNLLQICTEIGQVTLCTPVHGNFSQQKLPKKIIYLSSNQLNLVSQYLYWYNVTESWKPHL